MAQDDMRTVEATRDEICDGLLLHYKSIATRAHEWSSGVEHAIKCYREQPKILVRISELEGLLGEVLEYLTGDSQEFDLSRIRKALKEETP